MYNNVGVLVIDFVQWNVYEIFFDSLEGKGGIELNMEFINICLNLREGNGKCGRECQERFGMKQEE